MKNPDPGGDAFLVITASALLLFNILVGLIVYQALPDEPSGQGTEIVVSHGD